MVRWRCIHEEEIIQRYNWPQATPCSQLKWRMHTGWRASFPISLWEWGRDGRREFTSREVVSLAEANTGCAAHTRLFMTQACSLQANHSRESLQLRKVPSTSPGKRLCWVGLTHWFLAQNQKAMDELNNDYWYLCDGNLICISSDFRLEKWNQCSLTSPLPHCLQSSCYRHGQPTAQGSSPFPLLGFSKNISLIFPNVIFPGQQLVQLPWDTAWSWTREVPSCQL